MEEITAEFAVGELQEPVGLNCRPRVTVACKTDLGRVRENNEDKFEYFLPEDDALLATRGLVFLVCDGMGGHAAGQIASELTAKTFIDVYIHHPSNDIDTAARAGVHAANRYVLDVGRAIPSRRGMGTTLSALLLVQDAAYVVQVGDSRIYRLRHGRLEQLTVDQTWIEQAVRLGTMSREDAEQHPYKHVLTNAIGTEEDSACEVDRWPLETDDLYLLCSDGLNNHVTDDRIREILVTNSPSDACWKLVGEALAGGGSDNCTVMVVRVDHLEPTMSA